MDQPVDGLPRLLLVDEVERTLSESGLLHATDSYEVIAENKRLLAKIGELIEFEDTRKIHARGSEFRRAHSYGGLEIMRHVEEAVFVLGTAGVIKGLFDLLKAWLALKQSRKLVLETIGEDGRTTRLEVTAFDEKTFERLVAEYIQKEEKASKKPGKKRSDK